MVRRERGGIHKTCIGQNDDQNNYLANLITDKKARVKQLQATASEILARDHTPQEQMVGGTGS